MRDERLCVTQNDPQSPSLTQNGKDGFLTKMSPSTWPKVLNDKTNFQAVEMIPTKPQKEILVNCLALNSTIGR